MRTIRPAGSKEDSAPEEAKAASIGIEIPITIINNPAEPQQVVVPTGETGGINVDQNLLLTIGIAGLACISLIIIYVVRNKKSNKKEKKAKVEIKEADQIIENILPEIKESIKPNPNAHVIKVKKNGNG